MKSEILRQANEGAPVIGVGPMSVNCTEAAYQYSHEQGIALELIASRRQVECAGLGHGYVNGWTTEEFGRHLSSLREKYPKSRVFACRDHGGPWQGDNESGLSFEEAMERAKESYLADMNSGFSLLHIDPSVNGDGKGGLERVLSAARELMLFCREAAEKKGTEIHFEVGTEENVGEATSAEAFEGTLRGIVEFCGSEGIEKPLFVVGQTGSLVKEMRQVGNFDAKGAGELVECSGKYGVLLKEHNGDYISEYQFLERLDARVPAINVAPEFGVIESRAFVDFCMGKGRRDLARRFLEHSVSSGKWKKWMVDGKVASDYERGLISGHYVFSSGEFGKLKEEAGAEEFDSLAKERILRRIDFYCRKRG